MERLTCKNCIYCYDYDGKATCYAPCVEPESLVTSDARACSQFIDRETGLSYRDTYFRNTNIQESCKNDDVQTVMPRVLKNDLSTIMQLLRSRNVRVETFDDLIDVGGREIARVGGIGKKKLSVLDEVMEYLGRSVQWLKS